MVLSYGKTEAFDANVKKSIALLGDILNRKERANELLSFISDTETYLSSIGEGIDKSKKATVYLGCQSNYGTHGIESSSANYSIFDVSKIRNVLDENGYKGYQKSLDLEKLVKMNPQRIILDAGGLYILKTQLKEKPEIFNRLSAFKTARFTCKCPTTLITRISKPLTPTHTSTRGCSITISRQKNSTSITSKRRAKSIPCFWAKIAMTTSLRLCTAASKTRYIKI